MALEEKVGLRIKTYREALGLTPEALAEKCGLDVSVVKAMEAGEVIPALGILTKFSRALGQRLGTFMDDQFKPDPVITRAADLAAGTVGGRAVSGSEYTYQSLALGKPDRHMDPFHIVLKPGEGEKTSSHEGEELIICISGEVELRYGEETTVLKPGDTAYYNSVVNHALRALGGQSATIYGIVYFPA